MTNKSSMNLKDDLFGFCDKVLDELKGTENHI